MTCLQLFKQQNLAIVVCENTISFIELIGYIELANSQEIWPTAFLRH